MIIHMHVKRLTKKMDALHVNAWMSLFQNQNVTSKIVGNIIVAKSVHQQNMLLQNIY
jgi:hypothetical protein